MSCCNSCENGGACERTPKDLIHCQAMPYSPKAIDLIVDAHLAKGQQDVDRLTTTALVRTQPRTPKGTIIPWTDVPHGASPCITNLYRVVHYRVASRVAHARMQASHVRYRKFLAAQANSKPAN